MKKALASVLLLFVLQINFSWAQNKIDFGIFASTIPNQMEIRIKPNYSEYGTRFLTNAQFTVRWPVSSGLTSVTSGSMISPFFMATQGVPYLHNGYYYQVWATPGAFSVTWSANSEIVIQTFTYTNAQCLSFEIAHDSYVLDSINGDYYFEVNGIQNLTGQLYHASEGFALSTPGLISGIDTVYPGMNNINYSIDPLSFASSYTWIYSGSGAVINGSGNSITISFDSGATSGNLVVAGHDSTCGDGPFSDPLFINVLDGTSTISETTINQNSLRLFPNPAEGNTVYILVDSYISENSRVELANLLSETLNVLNLELCGETNSFTLDISNLANGLYVIKIISSNKIYSAKFTKLN